MYIPQILVTIRSRNLLPNGTPLRIWGSKGSRDRQFNQLRDIAVDPRENFVYTVELANYRVQKLDDNGNFITKWGFSDTGGAGADRKPPPIGHRSLRRCFPH